VIRAIKRSSAIAADGPRDMLVSRNLATTDVIN